ncbi:MAG: hypothetical protein K0U84_10190 [Actinomycetia bacterium]|nr:hypothetical protein [Actinomycetes bacterium]
MGNPPLRVDTPSLTWDPAVVTVPPVPVIPPGGDPMSLLISGILPELAVPLDTEVAATSAREEQFAANLAGARSAYQSADQAGEQEIRTAANPLATATPAASGSAGGQSGQMMSMAMQAASQAVQAPMQLMGMAAAAPQGLMQAGQGAFEQVSQLSGQVGKPEGESDLLGHDSPGESAPSGDGDAGAVEQVPLGEEPPVGEKPADDHTDADEQAPAGEQPPAHTQGHRPDEHAAAINL